MRDTKFNYYGITCVCRALVFCQNGLHLIMHRTIGPTGYIGPLTPTLTLP